MKPDFEKPNEVVKSDSSDDELEASQMSLYKKIRQSIKKTSSKDSNESSPPVQNSAPSFLPNNAPCDEYWNNDKLSDNESSGSESLPVARSKIKKSPKILESDSDGSDNLGIEPFEGAEKVPTTIKKSIGLLMSSDDNDTDDKDEVFEDDDGIPSFD